MKTSTQRITQGAMLTAIFAVLLLINRQTGGLFQEAFVFVLPLPMTAYAVRYGFKSSVPVLMAMCLSSLLFGSFDTSFYACSQSLLGLVFGGMLYHKAESLKVMFAVMGMSVLTSIANLLFMATLFGLDLSQEVQEYREMLNQMFTAGGVQAPETMMNSGYLGQMIILSYVFIGLIEGIVIFYLTLVVLKRLKFPVEKPKSVYCFFPPRWMGAVAALLFVSYYVSMVKPFDDTRMQNAVQILGMLGYMYLMVFGVMGVVLYAHGHFGKAAGLGGLAAIVLLLVMPMVLMVVGYLYSSTGCHLDWLKLAAEQQAQKPKPRF